jgi:aminomethyltransferase
VSNALKFTPLHSIHQALGARLVPFAGYEMPVQYKGIVHEHNAVRNQAGVFDVSHMGEIRVKGSRSLEFVNWLITNDVAKAQVGRAVYTCACNDAGTILDDLIIYKYAEDDLLIVCNASNHEKIWGHVQTEARRFSTVEVFDESEETALLALQGPLALEILGQVDKGLLGLQDELKSFRFARKTLAGERVTLARTGYTGEDGVEIFCAAERAPRVWQALFEVGGPLGLEPTGLGARDTLRLEARLSLYGNEIDETTTPLEAGLGWTVKFDKSDFLGKSALLVAQENGLARTLVGFEMIGRGVARSGYPFLDSTGQVVGHCTSGSPSPTLGKAIGLGYLPVERAEVGTEFEVDCRQKKVAAKVVPTPFYKRKPAGSSA